MHERYCFAVSALYHSSDYIALVEFVIREVIILALSVLEPGVESARLLAIEVRVRKRLPRLICSALAIGPS